jgi:HSP20 family protein
MTITRWNPINDFMSLQREFDRIFTSAAPKRRSDEEYESAVWSPVADITENNDKYTLHFDIPGVTREQVRISFSEGTLKVSGERQSVQDSSDETCHRMERITGKFYRSFTFPTQVDSDKINAGFKDGVLTITVPKAEEVKPRTIEIL